MTLTFIMDSFRSPCLYQCSTKEIVQRKLSMIRIVCDPMSLLYNSNFTSHDIPPFGLIDIFNYLVNSRADYDNKKLKAYKSFDDYRLYEDGHVQSLSLKKTEKSLYFSCFCFANLPSNYIFAKICILLLVFIE